MAQAWYRHGNGHAAACNLPGKSNSSTLVVALIYISKHLLHQIWKTCFHNLTFANNVEDSKSAHGQDLLILSTFFLTLSRGINLKEQAKGK